MEARLHESISSRQVPCGGLSIHVLECGDRKDEMILLLHGFPELAFSWRKVMPLLAGAGYRVVAPDMRGYGRTRAQSPADKGQEVGPEVVRYEDGLAGYTMIDTLAEMVSLIYTLHDESSSSSSSKGSHDTPRVRTVVGHDMGSSVAAHLALARPDIFQSLVMMSAPYTGPPESPASLSSSSSSDSRIRAKTRALADFATLDPPRTHYQHYFCRPDANADLCRPAQGLSALFRGYYYFKSALHEGNADPHPLGHWWDAKLMADAMPEYYIMERGVSMGKTVARNVPGDGQGDDVMSWMPDEDLAVYVEAFEGTGFQGGLNHYRARIEGLDAAHLPIFMGKAIEVPSTFISGVHDWGNYQDPGALERMQSSGVVRPGMFLGGCTFVPGAGHWVQQEQPERTAEAILSFIARARGSRDGTR